MIIALLFAHTPISPPEATGREIMAVADNEMGWWTEGAQQYVSLKGMLCSCLLWF
jgi:hypothetical protein